MELALKTRFNTARKTVMDEYFKTMNPMQKQAVFQIKGPVLILAGAGSGKTTVIVNRIANMILFGDAYESTLVPDWITEQDVQFLEEYAEGLSWDTERVSKLIGTQCVKPWNVLAITFTNRAAGELKERLQGVLGSAAQDIQASTFHSACVRILRREIERLGYTRSFTIYDTDDSVRVIKDALKALSLDDKRFVPKAMLGEIGRAKDRLLTPALFEETVGDDYRLQTIAKIYEFYQNRLSVSNAVDFDDIIMLTVKLLTDYPEVLEHYRSRYRYVMVDEYQDTNHAQYMLVSLLSKGHNNICVVGDDDQSIYKFRGANIENILSFEKQFSGAKVIRLEQNYRCTQNILDAANAVISNNTERKGKTLWTQNGTGNKIKVYRAFDENEEARFIATTISENVAAGAQFRDHAILYRMNAQSNMLERSFVKMGIPYRIIGGIRFYERKEVKDIVAYLSVMNNPSDTLRLRRIINEPKRTIGDATVLNVIEISQTLGVSAFEIMKTADQYEPLKRKASVLVGFAGLIQRMIDRMYTTPLDELLDQLLEESGYLAMLQTQGFEGQTRVENLQEFRSTISRYIQESEEPSLSGFLEEISLYTDMDTFDPNADHVVMMTMHSAKGLEFENVFLAGMEDGIFPGIQVLTDPEQVEEERRLAYVSLTRAKKLLYITNAAQRMMFGQSMRNKPSRFILEIPPELCDSEEVFNYVRHTVAKGEKSKPKNAASLTEIGVGKQQEELASFKIKAGDTVSHKAFGNGLVISVRRMGNDHLVEVAFDSVGTKKVMANFAKLAKI